VYNLRDLETLGPFGAVGGCVGFVWCNVQVSVSLRSLMNLLTTVTCQCMLAYARNTLSLAATFGILTEKHVFPMLHCPRTIRSRKGRFTISVPLFARNNFFFALSLLFGGHYIPQVNSRLCESEETQKREIANIVGADLKQEFEFIRHLRVSTTIEEKE
ncbi:hypothetical protein ALC62_00501, partial [Cyphomyrmex costatus]